jgi:pimeloyl-ACP methyl ester carboxylesterase
VPHSRAVAPIWFTEAVSTQPEVGSVNVQGASITFRAWGERGQPGVILVHGSAAHAHWWDHIGPQLSRGRRVVAITLSGHGDSGRRSRYTNDQWADEVVAVNAAAGCTGAPIVVAHSMGGQVAAVLAARAQPAISAVVFVDWAARDLGPDRVQEQRNRAFRSYRPRPDLDTAVRTFRPRPDHDGMLPFVLEHIARHSFRRDNDGWHLKFDPLVYDRVPVILENVQPLQVPSVLMHAELGTLTWADRTESAKRMGPNLTMVKLLAAHHHVMIDRPLVLTAALKTQLQSWAHVLR